METMKEVRQDTLAPADVSPQVTAAAQAEADALEAARALAVALAETPQYKALDQAGVALRYDEAAQGAIHALQDRQRALGWKLQSGLVSAAEREELRELQQAMLAQPAVQTYMDAQGLLARVCNEASGLISEIIGLSLASSCGPGCSCH
jgi:cell fate (sporulation/competence/biofilm development) regulator YlbF (YheA/YmcA/DUF963 family)